MCINFFYLLILESPGTKNSSRSDPISIRRKCPCFLRDETKEAIPRIITATVSIPTMIAHVINGVFIISVF